MSDLPLGWDAPIEFWHHPLTPSQASLAAKLYTQMQSEDRERYVAASAPFHVRPTACFELRAVIEACGVPGVPKEATRWPSGLVAMRRTGQQLERLFCPTRRPMVVTDAWLAQAGPAELWWQMLEVCQFERRGYVFGDAIALGPSA